MFAEFCIDKVDIISFVTTKDAAGGAVRTPTTAYTGVFCSIQEPAGNRVLDHLLDQQLIIGEVFFVVDYGIKVGWEIRPWVNATTAPTATSPTLRVRANSGYEPGQSEVLTVVTESRA